MDSELNSLELTRDVCRICLEHREKINWNNKIKEFCGISYKECYYKYTQVVEPDLDCFPTNLCNRCANELKNAHQLFEMALESLNILQNIFEARENEVENLCSKTSNSFHEISTAESFAENCATDEIHTEINEVICYSPVYEDAEENGTDSVEKETNNKFLYKQNSEPWNSSTKQLSIDSFKSVDTSLELNIQLEIHGTSLLKSYGVKNPIRYSKPYNPLNQSQMKKRCSINYETFQENQNSNRKQRTERAHKVTATNENLIDNSADLSLREPSNSYSLRSEQKSNEPSEYTLSKQSFLGRGIQKLSDTEETVPEQSVETLLNDLFGKDIDINALGARKPQRPRTLMCQYCSAKVNGSHHLRAHEATHLENRKRNVICPKCGIKLYTKETLNEHRKIHEENRTKKHKCEYCEKAFFHTGALNVHRRIHLGLMIKCQLCPKEFYRQIDLNKHMRSHSATTLQNNDIDVKKKKYKIQCQYCNKAILTTKWKAHKAAHLNQPQVKCKICDKNFFSRHSCSSHLRKTHQKERNEIEENIYYYVDCSGRMSHLMMKQQESLIES